MPITGDKRRSFDLVIRHSSVSTILYHTTLKKLIFVKQFRPAVLIAHALRQSENFGKKLSEIDWSKYDASHGYTLELCAGMIDKNIPTVDIAREEIEEECGYVVKNEDLQLVTTYNVAAHESGGAQYVFYTEIDDSMKVTEGGGNASEGEYITKVFLSEDEKIAQYEWHPRDITPLKDLHFEQMPLSSRFEPLRLHFTIGSLTRTWDLALCDESFAVLLYNEDTKELIFTQRFRPAALVGLALHHSPPKTKLDAIDWASQPPEWAYTLELCSGHHKRNCTKQEIEEKAKECVALKCGYKVEKLRFVTSYLYVFFVKFPVANV
ncbi:hydrolase, NUDIX family [Oesophagostomum dentatum]|uniref:Uridine diphosphate glucose pyrophosphatase NUDT14 n=1 Tax=Oesophagostomum dentatum TaxID=61180 RepID=A0A0B1S1J9_OESDE|nr:hydrolase, NUDIX family [Oesophagostomum dentatum]